MPNRNQPNRSQFVTAVVENTPLCREHFRLTLKLPAFPPTKAGQFIQIACRDLEDDASAEFEIEWQPGQRPHLINTDFVHPTAILRRPFSLAGRRDVSDGVELQIIHRVVGIGTDWMSRLAVGDAVSILGPLGNSFQMPPADHTAILVGGGVGIPPMLYLAEQLRGRSAIAFCGAMSRDLLPFTINADSQAEEFTRHGVRSVFTTDDGSFGQRGFVTQALEKHLDSLPTTNYPRLALYTCGPELMMKRVAQIANDRGISCQIAVERAMACGMGTCQSCCIKVKKPDASVPPLVGKDWCYRLACTDGPIFKATELLW